MVSLLAATAAVLVGGPLGITPRPSVTPTVISPSKRMAQMRRIVKRRNSATVERDVLADMRTVTGPACLAHSDAQRGAAAEFGLR